MASNAVVSILKGKRSIVCMQIIKLATQILRNIVKIIALYNSDFINFAVYISIVTRKLSQLC